ncbi:MAG: Flp pilus assembly protein CpaB [Alphaproteobacteria bacterium]
MNKNVLIVFGGAFFVAILVAVMVQMMMGKQPEPVKQVQEARVEILMAAKDLKLGSALKDGDMRWQDWPKAAVFHGAVVRQDKQKVSEALSGRLARDVAKGEPVTALALLSQEKGNIVAASLEPGMRAVAINVKAASMVSGFVGPGDFVDVVLTYKETVRADKDDHPDIKQMVEMNLDKMATETILQNVKVLAVDQSATRPDDGKVKVAKTVTLAVGVRDAERLMLAADLGALDLMLRGVGDDAVIEKDWETVSDARLTSVSDEILFKINAMKKDSSIRPDIVRFYEGGNVRSMSAR